MDIDLIELNFAITCEAIYQVWFHPLMNKSWPMTRRDFWSEIVMEPAIFLYWLNTCST